MRLASLLPVFLMALLPVADGPAAQERSPVPRSFSLSNRASLTLNTEWSDRPESAPPPLPFLLSSAPRLSFSDFLVLESRKAPAALEIGFSDNPFLGSDAQALEARTREGLASHLFYFFFPPPRACLARAKSAFEEARRKEEESREREEKSEKPGRNKAPVPPKPLVVTQACGFSPSPLDFFASQVSSSVVFRRSEKGDRVGGNLRAFYLPPMEQVEIAGKTFFIFEARAEHPIERPEIEAFGLADDWRGARAHFFWAIGGDSPFPFLRDAQRKDLQLVHVVYACLSLSGDARAEFRARLESIHFAP